MSRLSLLLVIGGCLCSTVSADDLEKGEAAFSVVSILRAPQALARPHDVEVDGRLMFVGAFRTLQYLEVALHVAKSS